MGDKKLNEWVEEEEIIPEQVPVFSVSPNGNSVNFEGFETVEKKVKHRVAYATLSSIGLCDKGNHYFEFQNGGKREGGRVHVKCTKCPVGGVFIVGIHKLENGKLLNAVY